MASKIKVDQLQTLDGTGTIALQNQLSGMTIASMPTGTVLQVVSGPSSLPSGFATSSSTFVSNGLEMAITPSATSSKIVVLVHSHGQNSSTGRVLTYTLYRDSTNLGGTNGGFGNITTSGTNIKTGISIHYLDSPSTTSSITYSMRVRSSGSSGNVEVVEDNTIPQNITLMEIKG